MARGSLKSRLALWKTLLLLVALQRARTALSELNRAGDGGGPLPLQQHQHTNQQARRAEVSSAADDDDNGRFKRNSPSRNSIVNLDIHALGRENDRQGGNDKDYAPKDMFENEGTDTSVVKRAPEFPSYAGKDSVIIIATVDGTLTGVSKRTGAILWKRGPNPPKQSSYRMEPTTDRQQQQVAEKQQANEDHSSKFRSPDASPLLDPWVSSSSVASRHRSAKTTAIPSIIDGKVYLTTTSPQSDTFLHEEEEVTAFIEDLVSRAPFVDRGRLFTATRDTTVCVVDTQTGAVHKQIPPVSSGDDERNEQDWIWLGRVDMAVTIHSPNQPDVHFSYSTLLSVHDMMLDSAEESPSAKDFYLLATPAGQAGLFDWTVKLDHPVAAAMDCGTGRIIPVKMVADLAAGRPLKSDLFRTTTIQGAIKGSGQLFAMPLISTGSADLVGYDPRAVAAARVRASIHDGDDDEPVCNAESQQYDDSCLSTDTASYVVVPYRPQVGSGSSDIDQSIQLQKRPAASRHLLTHWLPPLLLFLLVGSFELGRRRRDGKTSKNDHVIRVDETIVLGHGGGGTVVYAGTLDNRQVAVKRMLKTYNASADREISLLIESDGHPNVVRYFMKEVRGDFVYLALELCDMSLHDLIGHIKSRMEGNGVSNAAVLEASKTILRQVVEGVKHLHKLRIVHRDIKPNNLLLASAASRQPKQTVFDTFISEGYIAKISDMGLGKQLVGHSSYGGGSFINESSLRINTNGGASSLVGAGPGSVGWQAPEVMAARNVNSDASARSEGSDYVSDLSPLELSPGVRTSRSVDIFSLGCVFYSLLVPGCHPFGEWYEREANIMHNRPNLDALYDLSPEAFDLIKSMLRRTAQKRPTASEVGSHPFFWGAAVKLSFLCELSDRIEIDATATSDLPDTAAVKSIVLVVERNASHIVGTAWDSQIDSDLVSNVQRFRSYDPSSVRDLLRLLRNKHHHYDELSPDLKMKIGSKAKGLMQYFERRFPRLVLHCYQACQEMYHEHDPLLMKYDIPSNNTTSRPELLHRASSVILEEPAEDSFVVVPEAEYSMPELLPVSEQQNEKIDTFIEVRRNETHEDTCDQVDKVIVWHGSTAANAFQCRGWSRSDDEWVRRGEVIGNKRRDATLLKCAEDPKFRTRLCNHWDVSKGTFCPMRKKNKCIFAHSAVELRVKPAKRQRWGKLVDKEGNCKNANASGGEDTYGAAKAIEVERKQEGKWNTDRGGQQKGKRSPSGIASEIS